MRILCVHNSFETVQSLNRLIGQHYAVDFHQANHNQKKYLASLSSYGLVVVWVKLEIVQLIQICKFASQQAAEVPLLVVLDKNGGQEKAEVINAGADDCVLGTIGQTELLARIAALVRRTKKALSQPEFTLGHLVIDPQARIVTYESQSILVRRKEFDLLLYLARHQDMVIPAHTLLHEIWGGETTNSNTLAVCIYSLRQKIDRRFQTKMIMTVPGVGYKIQP